MAISFAVCGAISSILVLDRIPEGNSLLLPVPFALLCALLCLRNWRVVIAIPLMVAVWFVAFGFAYVLGHAGAVLGCLCGGLIGGFGLLLCAAICHRRLLSLRYTRGASLVGAVSALAFAPWAVLYEASVSSNEFKMWIYLHLSNTSDEVQTLALLAAFAIWQAAVGTYLYKIVRDIDKEARLGDSAAARS